MLDICYVTIYTMLYFYRIVINYYIIGESCPNNRFAAFNAIKKFVLNNKKIYNQEDPSKGIFDVRISHSAFDAINNATLLYNCY